jgi:hypothetical protein
MKVAQIENGIVVSVIVVGDPAGVEWATRNLPGQWVDGAGAEIGYAYQDGAFIPPAQPQDDE